jgi:HlyD family secretion protein
VKLNQKALISVDSFPEAFNGTWWRYRTRRFTPKTIQTRDERVKLMYAVKIALDNSEDRLRPGMPADA